MEKLTVVDNRFGESETLVVRFSFYQNGECQKDSGAQVAIRLFCEDGMPHSMATVCLTKNPPRECIWVKDYSENAGMVDMLVEAGLIHPEIKDVAQSGYAQICAYRMTHKLLKAVIDSIKMAALKGLVAA